VIVGKHGTACQSLSDRNLSCHSDSRGMQEFGNTRTNERDANRCLLSSAVHPMAAWFSSCLAPFGRAADTPLRLVSSWRLTRRSVRFAAIKTPRACARAQQALENAKNVLPEKFSVNSAIVDGSKVEEAGPEARVP
jgi:hypothetical protein